MTPPPSPDHPSERRLWRWWWVPLLGVSGLALVAGWLALRGSLPALDGRRQLAGLGAEVRVERDARGVPTLHAATHEDAARALGYLHAQDRFFQMDLMRRQSAGELAELFGPAAVSLDVEMRVHRFRHRAAGMLARFAPDELRCLDAYTAGVNAGLASLRVRPWEYLVLRQRPRPWSREDSLFVIQTMTLALQAHDGLDERTRQAILDTYGDRALAFLRPLVTSQSAALDGSSALPLVVPDTAALDPRHAAAPAAAPPPPPTPPVAWFLPSADLTAVYGSNSFALAGPRVATGSALVSNDMHLNLAVPNTWYRASLALPDRTTTGVTLPGVPGVVAGSNGDVAWGFTNAYVDACDAVLVERDPAHPSCYRVPDGDGWEPFEVARETVAVAGGSAKIVEITSTRWGPLIASGDAASGGQTLALRWLAHDPDAYNLALLHLMDARTLDEAIDIAHHAGIPAQNLLVGDRTGHIAWTIIGHVPRRIDFDGNLPQSWADGTHRWDGFLSPDHTPTIRDPPGQQLWTANNRVVGGDALALLGNGGYDLPARAAQIRDRLSALSDRPATPADGLAIQLDDESRFLARWRDLLRTTLTDDVTGSDPALADLRRAVDAWHGRADPREAGHRLVREFRQNVTEAVMNFIYEPVRQRAPYLNLGRTRFKDAEEPLWAILSTRPIHFLPPTEKSWDDLLLHAAAATTRLDRYSPAPPSLQNATWGAANILAMRHPFSRLLPRWLSAWIDMPAQPLPGDANMPRVQGPTFGASERMDVSPGHEREGLFHQPGGASGHPLSPFYRAGHDDWAAGRPAPFLPGPPAHSLLLQP